MPWSAPAHFGKFSMSQFVENIGVNDASGDQAMASGVCSRLVIRAVCPESIQRT
jgi:hypothetical protein